MDWNGGTYISQFHGDDLHAVILLWADSIDPDLLELQQGDKAAFLADVGNETTVKLDGLTNVWAISPELKEQIATVNIVLTE